MIVAATAPLICSTTRRANTRYSRMVARIQNRKSIRNAVRRSPLLATSASRAMPSGVTISRRLRATPSRKRLIRSSRWFIAGTATVGAKIGEPEHAGRQPEGHACGRVGDQLTKAALDDAGNEQHQHGAGRQPGGGRSLLRQVVEAGMTARGKRHLCGHPAAD